MGNCCKHIFRVFVLSLFFLRAGAQSDSVELLPPPVQRLATDTIFEQAEPPSSQSYQFKDAVREQVNTRKVSDDEVKKLKSDDAYWYVNEVPPREKRKASNQENKKGKKGSSDDKAVLNIPWLRVFFWILLITGFIALLVWFLRTSNIRLFGKKNVAVEETPEEEISDNIFEMNFETEIQKAVNAKNYRLAVRLMYLRTLRDLSNQNLIQYTHEKTNSDYLFQLAETVYYKEFFRLTRDFDYTWYGHFELSQDSFTLIQDDFSAFKQKRS
jgi:hypothetical protein